MPVKYLGSKRTLIPTILEKIGDVVPRGGSVIDLFSGTARVGYALKSNGYSVTGNDLTVFGYVNASAYLEGDPSMLPEVQKHLERMNHLDPSPGWFTETYAKSSRYFSEENAAKIDSMRSYLKTLDNGVIKNICTVSLIEAADRVDSTVGIQMAYLKNLAKRAYNPLELKAPVLVEGFGKATQGDAVEMVKSFPAVDAYYLDPPYNTHNYTGNYHIWETLAIGDDPPVYGVACKRTSVRDGKKSSFNSKKTSLESLLSVVEHAKAQHIFLSFSDEGFLSESSVVEGLTKYGDVSVCKIPYRRYIGSKIGIHNPSGERVGVEGKRENQEILYLLRKK